MALQNRGDARHVCYGKPKNQAINWLAKDIKICKCCLNWMQNDTCKDGVQDKIA
jgi:hypothetical protein